MSETLRIGKYLPLLGLHFVVGGLLFAGKSLIGETVLFANGTDITFEEGRKLADAEMLKHGYILSEWELGVNSSNSEWEKVRDLRRNSPVAAAREYFKKQEAKLEGKRYWSFQYRYRTPQGTTTKDGVIWVFLSVENGEVLLYIPPGY